MYYRWGLRMDLDEAVSPIEHLKSIFDLCDEDHDGVISVNEFRLLCHQHLGAATQQVEKLIKELDATGNGKITFENFSGGIQAYLLARRDSSSSTISDSPLSLTGFGDELFITSSPTLDGMTQDPHHSPNSNGIASFFTYEGVNDERSSDHSVTELIANGTDDEENTYSIEEHEPGLSNSTSFPRLEIKPSGISPTLIARSLMKKHNHSFLHVSGGSDTYCSTPDGIYDDQDELTEKLQELSNRLEGLELDLDSSHSQKIHLKRENISLLERIERFEERIREIEFEKEEIERIAKETFKSTTTRLKRSYEDAMDELRMELQQTLEQLESLQSTNAILSMHLDESKEECELKNDQISRTNIHISELDDELKRTRDQLRTEREKWDKQRRDSEHEVLAMTQLIEHLRKELEDGKNTKKRQTISNADLRSAEIMLLKREIKILKEDNNRVSAQLLQHGKVLVNQKPKSLAQELRDAPRGDIMRALKEQETHNERLKSYIEGLLVTILDKHPELLEIK